MKPKMTLIMLATVTLFGLSVGRANAKSDKESCKSTTADVSHINTDDTECETAVSGSGPNSAKATASGKAFAESAAEDGGTATAKAGKGGIASTTVISATGDATASGLMGEAVVELESGGKGTAKANGAHSLAVSSISGTSGGLVQSNAAAGSDAVAEIESNGGGNAVANAKQGATALADIEGIGGGTATAAASGSGAVAESVAGNHCRAATTATGANSQAVAVCENADSVVTVSATKGSTAEGSDTSSPTCTPMNGGKARVRSPGGNCG